MTMLIIAAIAIAVAIILGSFISLARAVEEEDRRNQEAGYP